MGLIPYICISTSSGISHRDFVKKYSDSLPLKKEYLSFSRKNSTPQNDKDVINNKNSNSNLMMRTLSFCGSIKSNNKVMTFKDAQIRYGWDEVAYNEYIQRTNLKMATELLQQQGKQKDAILQNSKSIEQLLTYISSEIDENGNLVSGLIRPLKLEEAIEFLDLGFDSSQVNNYIKLKDAHFTEYLLKKYLNDKPLLEKYLLFTSTDVDADGILLSGLPRALFSSEALGLLSRNRDYTVEQASCYVTLSKMKVPYEERFAFIDNPKLIDLYNKYTSSSLLDSEMFSFGLTRPLTGKEAYDAIHNEYTPEQITIFTKINDVIGYSANNYKFVNNPANLELLKRYQNTEKSAQGELISGLSRPLTFEESFISIYQGFDNVQIEKFLEFKEKLSCVIESSIDFDVQASLFVKTVKDIPFEEFYDYVQKIDMQQVMELAPRIANYNPRQMLQFLSYHYRNGKVVSFAPENLVLSNDFTSYLMENYLSAEKMSQLLSACPNTSREVGTLPNGWLNNIPIDQQSTVKNKVYQTITNFQHSGDIDVFAKSMTAILGKEVVVSELGSGAFGTGYKIHVDGCEDVCLKLFVEKFTSNPKYIAGKDYGRYIHGQYIETQTGLFLNAHSDEYAHMYFGRVSAIGEKDGFIVTEFLSDSTQPLHLEVVKDSNYTIISLDSSGDHNIINGKIIDYGAVIVGPKK